SPARRAPTSPAQGECPARALKYCAKPKFFFKLQAFDLRGGKPNRVVLVAVTAAEDLRHYIAGLPWGMAVAAMHLDVGTLSVVTVFVTALLGALLVFAGMQNRSIRAPMWWGAAQIVGAVGLGLSTSRGLVSEFVAVDLANALVLLSYGLIWAGARNFDG